MADCEDLRARKSIFPEAAANGIAQGQAQGGGRREHLGDARFAILECLSDAVLLLLLLPVSDDGVRLSMEGRRGE
jgi:hypothetical protein